MSLQTDGEALATRAPRRAGAQVVARTSGYVDSGDEEHPTLKM